MASIHILSPSHSASIAYFFGSLPSTKYFILINSTSSDGDLSKAFEGIKPGDLAVISRTISSKLKPWISKGKKHGVRIVYFMDDDLFDLRTLSTLPLAYAFRIWANSLRHQYWLQTEQVALWVSTPYLARKYQSLSAKLLRPINPSNTRAPTTPTTPLSQTTKSVRICYHGTWSHKNEIKWLVPIIREVQRRCPNTIFEIIGGDRVARLFKGIPRVEVLDTMPWPQYLEHTSNVRQDIGLAPLMDTLFNRGRGPIKFFDYARAGAVGIYSKGPAFGDFVADGVDGFLLDNDPQQWIEKIVELVNNPQLRQAMADKAWEKVLDNSPASQSVQDYLNGFQT